MPRLDWRKSSYCQEGSSCLYLAASAGTILLRESEVPGTILTTTPARLRPLIAQIKAGPSARLLRREAIR
ncbi:DUF397 domain-containing protein [Streptomyces telluris]|uniref:DUF397 domain-containing protein n=1 Tax=Streptomyces telluris TaxID=2720021 RepID=A0A9X2LF79_9ACTN|nr:DUF397 domain-containing protein [Streptomyces telluris]MCQ8769946.1 DUF397 domain-containing protein [Streptomyces telluris]NJP82595.1 DUF397 domain-containing protein [Streptomyces telluris]